MGWAVCTPTVIYNAFRLQKRAKKSHKDYSCAASAAATASLSNAASTRSTHAPAETQSAQNTLSRSLSTDDSSSENNSSVFTQDEDMQYQLDLMDQRDREHRCPCGCPGQNFHEERDSIRMRTKEILTRNGAHVDTVDRAFGFEVLRHQGRHYCPEDIAPVWKKDCRTWLWKSNEKPKRIQLSDKDRRSS
ncbi:uncharacterized protein LOC117641362 [Thrips palmi]|uniref:Uncharacterized protein LOC117641362 n=1 Tax=Thrips palmi TaxID=161013 RepID=A0A6P8ZJ04_THRPL|nr:uncharacterized protein LOC117641362 [Thrips palmi]